jgi:thiamine transport system permease protein
MAGRAFKINPLAMAGAVVLLLLSGFVAGPLVALWLKSDPVSGPGPADMAAIRFTLMQAALSALVSVVLAIPVARALARRRFFGRGVLITLTGAPFILPVMVAVLGLLAIFGRSGVISEVSGFFGGGPVRIYGLHGVVLAHVFFNMPLVTRLILQGWAAIPAERFRLAASLDFGPRQMRRVLEYPMLRAVLPGAFMVVFLICMTSFAVVLALGGGPKATTVELAIYQAFRFDFDLGRAAMLAGVQFGLGAVVAGVMLKLAVPDMTGSGLDRVVMRGGAPGRWIDMAVLLAAGLFLVAPLAMIVLRGLPNIGGLPVAVYWSAGRSVVVALCSMALAVGFGLVLALFVVRERGAVATEAVAYLMLAASPLVIGAGLFILLFPVADPVALALPVTALVNAVMSVPFVLRSLVPAVRAVVDDYGRLTRSLDMGDGAWLRLVLLPRIRRPLGFSAGLAAALSMGDLGVIALFSSPDGATLPLQLYRLMSSYRMDDAAGAALLLAGLSLLLFRIFDRGGRVDVDA